MSSKFEKLIEYVINDEEQKARDLFHEIVVEKSRSIYEDLMSEELKEESEEEESEEEEMEESVDMEMETIGGDAADQLLHDVAADETAMEDDEEVMDLGAEEEMIGGDEDFADETTMGGDIEGDIASIDSKLDELLAKFEEVIGGDEGGEEDFGDEEFGSEEEEEAGEEEEEVEESLAENVALQKVAVDGKSTKLAGAGAGGDRVSQNDKSTVAANAGAGVTGSVAKPATSKFTETNPDGTKAPSAQKAPDIESGLQNAAGKNMSPLKPATKPHLAQATGVNTKSTLKPIKK